MGITTDGQDQIGPGGIAPDSVGSPEIIDLNVATADLANGAVTEPKLANGSVTVNKIADNSVTNAKMADNAITDLEIAAGAAIQLSKLATDPLARANHTGSQLASTISDFATAAGSAATAASVGGDLTGTVGNAQVAAGVIGLTEVAAAVLARANHTGTQLASTISDFSSAADARIAAASINALSDVTISGAVSGEILRWNGTQWINEPKVKVDGSGRLELTETSTFGGVIFRGEGYIRPNGSFLLESNANWRFNDSVVRVRVSSVDRVVLSGTLDPIIHGIGSASTTGGFGLNVTGDVARRLRVLCSGEMLWGDGTAVADVSLSRSAANTLLLAAGDILQVQQDPAVDNDVARKKYVDDLVAANTVFGDHYAYDEDLVGASATGTTRVETARINIVGVTAGDYLISWDTKYFCSNNSGVLGIEITRDPDGAATVIDGFTHGSVDDAGKEAAAGFKKVTLGAGNHSFSVEMFHSSGTGSSTIVSSKIQAWRVS